MLVDISAYAGQTVQIAFHIDDDGAYSTSYPYPPLIAYGWYIDDIDIIEGNDYFLSPEHFEEHSWDRVLSFGHWYADHGIWEIGDLHMVPVDHILGEYVLAQY